MRITFRTPQRIARTNGAMRFDLRQLQVTADRLDPLGGVAESIVALCFVLGVLWYPAAMTLWFKLQRRTHLARAFLRTLGTFLVASLVLVLVALLGAYGLGRDSIGQPSAATVAASSPMPNSELLPASWTRR